MTIGRFSLGTAQLGMPYGIAGQGREPTEGAVKAILQTAIDLGIRAVDTAPGYGVAEERIGAFLAEHDLFDEVSLCTKLPALGDVDAHLLDQRIEERLTGSLRRLRCDFVDCYLIHDARDLRVHGEAIIEALLGQRQRGRILEIGVSVYEPAELAMLADFPEIGVIQHPFNLLDRRLNADGWPSRLASAGIKLQIRSVLLQGLLAMEPGQVPEAMTDAHLAVIALREILDDLGLALPEAAVAFALTLDADRVVIGADSPAQLEQLAAAADLSVPSALSEIVSERLGTLPPSVIDPRAWP